MSSEVLHYEHVIIGGGIAGLSAAIRLTELGAIPLVIESGNYPSQKICGEFFSPECVKFLKNWNVHPLEITQARFHLLSESLHFKLPFPAGSLSHFVGDLQLKMLAEKRGATVLVDTKVLKVKPRAPLHEIELSNGSIVRSVNLIIATGRIPDYDLALKMRYAGIKANFSGPPIQNALEMFVSDGAYVGISPVGDGQYNVACLADIRLLTQMGSAEAAMQKVIARHPLLEKVLGNLTCLLNGWMSTVLPEFGIRKTPSWPNVYFIGDAAGTIPPITGQGLSMGMQSGIMAAEYASYRNAKGFKAAWRKKFASSIYWGKLLHHAAMRPKLCVPVIKLAKHYPLFARGIYRLTR